MEEDWTSGFHFLDGSLPEDISQTLVLDENWQGSQFVIEKDSISASSSSNAGQLQHSTWMKESDGLAHLTVLWVISLSLILPRADVLNTHADIDLLCRVFYIHCLLFSHTVTPNNHYNRKVIERN